MAGSFSPLGRLFRSIAPQRPSEEVVAVEEAAGPRGDAARADVAAVREAVDAAAARAAADLASTDFSPLALGSLVFSLFFLPTCLCHIKQPGIL